MRNHNLTEIEKIHLRKSAIEGARYYKHYLLDKTFLIITDDYKTHEITFYAQDYMHLTGLKVNLADEITFFELCIKGHLTTGNIMSFQIHNKSTLKSKSKVLLKLKYFLHAQTSTNLYLYELSTATYSFPAAIRNDVENCTIAFKGVDLHARSVRRATNSLVAKETHMIMAIFEKENNDPLPSRIIYIRNVTDILNNISSIGDQISQSVFEHLTKLVVSENSK